MSENKNEATDINARLIEFEHKHNLGKHSYGGVYYWNLIRTFLQGYIYEQMSGAAYIPPKVRNAYFSKRFYFLLKACIGRVLHPRKPRLADVLLMYDQYYKEVDGARVNVYLDYIQTDYSIERITLTQSFIPEGTRGKYPNNAIRQLQLTVMLRLYRWNILRLSKDERRFIAEIESDLNQTFGIKNKRLERIISSTLLYNRLYTKHARQLLDRVRPKIVFLANYGFVHNSALCEECRLRGITCVDMLHGVFFPGDIYYTVAEPYFIPKYVFTFGERTKEAIRLAYYGRGVAVGSPYREARLKKFGSPHSDEKGVVFYSDPEMDKFFGFIASFKDIVAPLGYRVYFKPRLLDLGTEGARYKSLTDAGITLLGAEEDIYKIFLSYKHHVGIVSTVLFEALMDHTRVYMIENDFNYNTFGEYAREGYFVSVSSPEDLAAKLEDSDSDNRDTAAFWAPNAAENIRRAIESIMAGEELY